MATYTITCASKLPGGDLPLVGTYFVELVEPVNDTPGDGEWRGGVQPYDTADDGTVTFTLPEGTYRFSFIS